MVSCIRIRIQHFKLNPDTVSGFWWQKLEKMYSLKKFNIFLFQILISLSQGLHKGQPSYRRSLQPSKENIQHFKMLFLNFFVVHFCPPGSGFNPDQKHWFLGPVFVRENFRFSFSTYFNDWIFLHIARLEFEIDLTSCLTQCSNAELTFVVFKICVNWYYLSTRILIYLCFGSYRKTHRS